MSLVGRRCGVFRKGMVDRAGASGRVRLSRSVLLDLVSVEANPDVDWLVA